MKRRELLKLAVAGVLAPSALKDKPKAEKPENLGEWYKVSMERCGFSVVVHERNET